MSKFKRGDLLRGAKIKRSDGTVVTFLRWGRGAGGVSAWIDTGKGLATMTANEVQSNNPQYTIAEAKDL